MTVCITLLLIRSSKQNSYKDAQLDLLIKELSSQKTSLKESVETNKKLLGQKKSSEIVTGHISEKLAPLTKIFKYDPRDAIFLGMPVDYLIFGENEIVFLEVKSGRSQLTSKQRAIKQLVEEKKIKWDTIRISGDVDVCDTNSDLNLDEKLSNEPTIESKE